MTDPVPAPDNPTPSPRGEEPGPSADQGWFRTTVYSIGDAVITTDRRGLVREMNPPAEQLTGWTEAEARGLPVEVVFRIIHEGTRAEVPSPVERVLREGIVVGLANHTLLISRSGVERPIADSGAPIRLADGSIAGAVLVFRDQSAERAAARALETAAARLREAQRIGRLGSWEIDLSGGRHFWSEEMYTIFDGTPASLGHSVWAFLDTVHPDDRPTVEAAFNDSIRSHTPYDVRHRIVTPSGQLKHVHSRGETIYDGQGRPLRTVGTLLDVTDRVAAEESLAHQASLVDSVSDAVISGDLDYRILSWNRGAEAIYGWTAAEAVGKTFRELVPTKYLTGSREQALAAMERDGYWRGELLMTRKDGATRFVLSSISLLTDRAGRPTGTVAVNRDITEQRRLEAALAQAQKMESVGRLAGGVAHDFNNALQVILNLAEMGLEKVGPDHPAAAELGEIGHAARRSANLARQLLAFARQQTAQPLVIDLNETAAGIRQMLERLIGESITIQWRPAPDLWRVRIDPSQIDQILANLVVNSRDAIGDVGTIEIRTANRSFDGELARRHPDLPPGDYVELSVRDTGSGMDPATLELAFEPFFTTKEVGKGTGLGLPVVYGIVKQYEGAIQIDSAPGAGTTVRILFPRWHGDPARTSGPTRAVRDTRGSETILIVEDEEQILSLVRRALEREGYRVLGFRNPLEAAEHVERWNGALDLVVTDVVMPNLTGRDLVRRILRQRPAVRCLFVSGYPAEVIARHGVVEEGIQLLQKPFTVRELAEKVREILDGRSA